MIKTELIKLFEKIGNETDTFAPFITYDEFENLADEIVKLLNLHNVSVPVCEHPVKFVVWCGDDGLYWCNKCEKYV